MNAVIEYYLSDKAQKDIALQTETKVCCKQVFEFDTKDIPETKELMIQAGAYVESCPPGKNFPLLKKRIYDYYMLTQKDGDSHKCKYRRKYFSCLITKDNVINILKEIVELEREGKKLLKMRDEIDKAKEQISDITGGYCSSENVAQSLLKGDITAKELKKIADIANKVIEPYSDYISYYLKQIKMPTFKTREDQQKLAYEYIVEQMSIEYAQKILEEKRAFLEQKKKEEEERAKAKEERQKRIDDWIDKHGSAALKKGYKLGYDMSDELNQCIANYFLLEFGYSEEDSENCTEWAASPTLGQLELQEKIENSIKNKDNVYDLDIDVYVPKGYCNGVVCEIETVGCFYIAE